MFTLKLYYYEFNKVKNTLIKSTPGKLTQLKEILLNPSIGSIITANGLCLRPIDILGYYILIDQDSAHIVFNIKVKFKDAAYISIPVQCNKESKEVFHDFCRLINQQETNKFIEFKQCYEGYCMFRHYKEITGVKYDFCGSDLSKVGQIDIFEKDEDEVDGPDSFQRDWV